MRKLIQFSLGALLCGCCAIARPAVDGLTVRRYVTILFGIWVSLWAVIFLAAPSAAVLPPSSCRKMVGISAAAVNARHSPSAGLVEIVAHVINVQSSRNRPFMVLVGNPMHALVFWSAAGLSELHQAIPPGVQLSGPKPASGSRINNCTLVQPSRYRLSPTLQRHLNTIAGAWRI